MARKKKSIAFIDRYKTIRVLGQGGMGTVYLCHDPDLEREVAIKLMAADKRHGLDNARLARFHREALTTARLQHPAIPPVYAVGRTADDLYYYVMKPIDGRPLREILALLREGEPATKNDFDLFRLVSILHDVCQAIHYAHCNNFIHRDLKPSNIFVGDYGEVYVIDWGLSKNFKAYSDSSGKSLSIGKTAAGVDLAAEISTKDSTITQSVHRVHVSGLKDSTVDTENTLTIDGDILGTIAYMPPEQAAGRVRELGPGADIYALGVILYEILTCELPVSGTDLANIIKTKSSGDFLPPERRNPGREIPPELAAITMQAMSPNPANRFKSALEFARSLQVWLEGKSRFHTSLTGVPAPERMLHYPKSGKNAWKVEKESISSISAKTKGNCYMLFNREIIGDVRFSLHIIANPLTGDNNISEFGLVLHAALPDTGAWHGYLDCCSVHFGASNNTRAFIAINESEVVSNEYVALEPRRRYRISVERVRDQIRVMLNRQIILHHVDRNPQSGLHFGLLHRGPGIEYTDIRIQERGLPTTTAAIDVPEALMAEGCYEAARKRFMAIARAHKERYAGAFARYRAGIALHHMGRKRREIMKTWAPLLKGPYAVLEYLGRAKLELEYGHEPKAAGIITAMLESDSDIPHLDPVADFVFERAQHHLRKTGKSQRTWRIINAWARLALILGQRLESKRTMTPSILWRWLLLAITRYPRQLPGCLRFLKETFGRGQGAFAEILTTINPLMTILRRSAGMSEHAYLMDKVMRLILSYDDNLGNLETLARFYLHAGHEEVALRISRHIFSLCLRHDFEIPPMPIAYMACREWLCGDCRKARKLFRFMLERSGEWAVADGLLLLGLDLFAHQKYEAARRCWTSVEGDANAITFNRHIVAKGLLGKLPADPEAAKVPQRSDHRLLYCLFVGYRHFLEWRHSDSADAQETAISLLQEASSLIRPSYDIYSATDTFSRIPLEIMGYKLPERPSTEPLTKEEQSWLDDLAAAAEKEPAAPAKQSSTGQRHPTTFGKKQGKRRRRGSNPPKDRFRIARK